MGRERRWFVLNRPRCDINGESETEVTVTSKQHAQKIKTLTDFSTTHGLDGERLVLLKRPRCDTDGVGSVK